MCFSAPEYCSTNATNAIEKYVEYLDKVEKYYNWLPKTDLKIGLYAILEWMKKNHTLIKPHF